MTPSVLFSQADVEVNTILKPDESQGFLYWNTSDSLNEVDNYKIAIYYNHGTLDSLDLQPVKAYITTNDYFRISNDFIDSGYFYKIIARTGTTEVGEEGPKGVVLGDYNTQVVCSETCAHRDVSANKAYAWTLEVTTSDAFPDQVHLKHGKRDLGNTMKENFFYFVNAAAWNGDYLWEHGRIRREGGGEVVDMASTNLCYRMPNGNTISTGMVYAIPMPSLPAPASYSREISSAQYNCDFAPGNDRRQQLMNLVNSTGGYGPPISPSINCNPYPYCGPTHGTGDDLYVPGWMPGTPADGSGTFSIANLLGLAWSSMQSGGGNNPDGLWDPFDNNHTPLDDINEILHSLSDVFEDWERSEADSLTEKIFLSDLVSFTITPISVVDEAPDVEVFVFRDVFTEEIEFDSINVSLPSGLYSFCLNFVDGDRVNYYFLYDHVDDEDHFQLADFLDVKLYPVPVTEHQFQIDLSSSNGELLEVDYKLFDLSGVLLDEELNLEIGTDKVTIMSNFPLSISSEYLVAKFFLSDGSQKDVLLYAQ